MAARRSPHDAALLAQIRRERALREAYKPLTAALPSDSYAILTPTPGSLGYLSTGYRRGAHR